MKTGKHRILLVNADDKFRKLLKCIFNREGYEVCTANSFEEGIEALRTNPEFSIIIAGNNDGGMAGIRFLKKAKEISPASQRILISHTKEDEMKPSINEPWLLFGFHQRPVLASRILDTINMAVKVYENKQRGNLTGPDSTGASPAST